MRYSLILFISIFIFSSYAYAQSVEQPKYKFNLKSLSGQKLALKDYKGEIVVVNFWASWCGPCEKEMKHLNKIGTTFSEQGVAIIGVNLDNDKKSAKRHLKQLKKRPLYPILFDKRKKAMSNFGVVSVPSTYIFDADGKLLHLEQGYIPGQEKTYRKVIRQAIKKADAT